MRASYLLVLGLVMYVVLAAFWFTPAPAVGSEEATKATETKAAETKTAETKTAEKAPKFEYIGTQKCAMCHKSEAKGGQFQAWEKSPHAKAFATLQSDKAKTIAADKKLAKPAHESPECLSCHATAAKVADPATAKIKMEDGVTCESCHGPGSAYSPMATMKAITAGTQDAKAVGLVKPDAAVCTTCHNEKSPTFKGFKAEEYMAKIAHPDPTKKKK